jgi:hypothetical protein
MSGGYAPIVGKVYSEIDEKLPKADLRWFRILGPSEVGYLDFVGSGAETTAHARENGPHRRDVLRVRRAAADRAAARAGFGATADR